MGFFDKYPAFYRSVIGATPERLNARYNAIIGHNLDLIRGKRILDLASHDGRWTLAALKAGASEVIAVEYDPEVVEESKDNLSKYHDDSNWTVLQGDAHQISHLGKFDLVFCLGFFYHTMRHYDLLAQMSAVSDNLILDGHVLPEEGARILVRNEPDVFAAGANDGLGPKTAKISGIPSKEALNLLVARFGYDHKYVDWTQIIRNIGASTGVDDYANNKRATLIATRPPASSSSDT